MKIKTSELTGGALDWAVAVALGCEGIFVRRGVSRKRIACIQNLDIGAIAHGDFSPSINWEQGGPLVERFQIYTSPPHIVFATKIVNGNREPADRIYDGWTAKISAKVAKKPPLIEGLPGLCGLYVGEGPAPLIAICRAVVACKLGEEVEVPDELVQGGAA